MEFCPECESIIFPKMNEQKQIELFCTRCGFKSVLKKDSTVERITIKERLKHDEDDIPIIEDEPDFLPTKREICERCDNDTAYYWMLENEDLVIFYRCKKCNHTWRE